MLDRVLVAESVSALPVGALDGVEGVPTPLALRHVRQGTVDAALDRHRVGARGVHLGDAGNLEAMAEAACGRAESGSAGTNHDGVVAVAENLVSSDLRVATLRAAPAAMGRTRGNTAGTTDPPRNEPA